MKIFPRFPIPFLISFGIVLCSFAFGSEEKGEPVNSSTTPIQWSTNYQEALNSAKRDHKLILLDFTGSDWCVWCHRLHDEVFAQKAFESYAESHLILVELDYSRKKQQDAATKNQNAGLSEQFSVSGYPTIVLLDENGSELGRTGYMAGGAKTFVRELKRFAAKAKKAP